MNTRRMVPAALLAALALWACGCSKAIDTKFLPNEKPTIRLTQAPIASDSLHPYFYAYRMNWVGFDPDGRVDYYLYKVDPPAPIRVDNTWTRTTKNEETIPFSAANPRRETPTGWISDEFHTFAIAAVDNNGEASDPVYRSFFSFTIAPSVSIVEPSPGSDFTPSLPPSVRITWRGEDPDGVFTQKPVRYVFRLFTITNPDRPQEPNFILWATAHPDSFRALYAPEFRGWQESGPESTSASYTDLTPNQLHMFVVTGFDEAGAYDPNFNPDQNMYIFEVSFAGTLGPVLNIFNEFFNYEYNGGGYALDQSRWIIIEVPADQKVTFNWTATPPEGGAVMRSYRWAMAGPGHDFTVDDESTRTNELTDWFHWSRRSLNTTSATVGPFTGNGDIYFFYIEGEDNTGLRSLGIVRFTVVRPTFENPLLFVDDTRLSPDQFTNNVLEPPRGQWPSAAELDTFFFAKGGVPWRGYPPRPGGADQLSSPGIFNGYAYDTIGTRGIGSGVLPLSILGKYRHVVWYTDQVSSTFTGNPLDPRQPITSLRKLTTPGNPSTFSTWIKQGGRAWVFGGGAAYATLIEWNRRNTSTDLYTDDDLELVPGRFMYDFAHWRAQVRTPTTGSRIRKFIPQNANAAFDPQVPSNPWWTLNPETAPGRGWSGQPDYSSLPVNLNPRTAASDPLPPLRSSSNFYFTDFAVEALDQRGNFIREDADGNPETPLQISTLDTLYYFTYPGATGPAMTYYHGRDIGIDTVGVNRDLVNRPFLFSGFPLWHFRRTQIMPVADWVLQNLWGMQRDAGAPRSITVPRARAQRAQLPDTPLGSMRARRAPATRIPAGRLQSPSQDRR